MYIIAGAHIWLACDAILDFLQRLAKSLSPILSMIHPQDNMVFRDSLIGP